MVMVYPAPDVPLDPEEPEPEPEVFLDMMNSMCEFSGG